MVAVLKGAWHAYNTIGMFPFWREGQQEARLHFRMLLKRLVIQKNGIYEPGAHCFKIMESRSLVLIASS